MDGGFEGGKARAVRCKATALRRQRLLYTWLHGLSSSKCRCSKHLPMRTAVLHGLAIASCLASTTSSVRGWFVPSTPSPDPRRAMLHAPGRFLWSQRFRWSPDVRDISVAIRGLRYASVVARSVSWKRGKKKRVNADAAGRGGRALDGPCTTQARHAADTRSPRHPPHYPSSTSTTLTCRSRPGAMCADARRFGHGPKASP